MPKRFAGKCLSIRPIKFRRVSKTDSNRLSRAQSGHEPPSLRWPIEVPDFTIIEQDWTRFQYRANNRRSNRECIAIRCTRPPLYPLAKGG